MRKKEEMEDNGGKTHKWDSKKTTAEFAGIFIAGPLMHSLTSSRTQDLKWECTHPHWQKMAELLGKHSLTWLTFQMNDKPPGATSAGT